MKTLTAMLLALLTLTGCSSEVTIDEMIDTLAHNECAGPIDPVMGTPEVCTMNARQGLADLRTSAIAAGCEDSFNAFVISAYNNDDPELQWELYEELDACTAD